MRCYLLLVLFCLFGLMACGGIDKSAVQARAGAPVSAQVNSVHIPYNYSYPKFVLAVKPIRVVGNISNSVVRQNLSTDTNIKSNGSWNNNSDVTSHVDRITDFQIKGGKETVNSDSPKVVSYQKQMDLANIKEHQIGNQTTKSKGGAGQNIKGQTAIKYDSHSEYYTSYLVADALKMQAMFNSALSGVENFKLMSEQAVRAIEDGKYSSDITGNQQGPFIVQALITEYSERISEDQRKIDLLVYDRDIDDVEGLVSIDISVIDGRDGSIAAAFPVHGTFNSKALKTSTIAFSRKSFARSLYTQAMRVALNQAAEEMYLRLVQRY